MQGTKNLTQGPIKRQLFNLALPIMGTSFIQMAYSITDMAWVGRLGLLPSAGESPGPNQPGILGIVVPSLRAYHLPG